MSDESLKKIVKHIKNNFTLKFNKITGRTELRTFMKYESVIYIDANTSLEKIEEIKWDVVSMVLENIKHEVLTDKEEAILRGEHLLLNITQHVPNFCDGVKSKVAEFSTTEELVAIPFVASFANNKSFSGYALSEDRLMATYRNGDGWWVIGYLSDPEKIDLPVWKPNKPGKIL